MNYIPHRKAHGLCPINGLRDLIHWRAGRDWSNEFLWGLALGGGFVYLRVNVADPPRQVFWGNSPPRQHEYLAGLLGARCMVMEGRVFKSAWGKAREAVDAGTPPVLGPLDMFHLHYYQGTYHRRHIPIHYVLLVGYDDGNAYIHDTDQDEVQAIPLADLQAAWDVNVPGMGKRNRLATFDAPPSIPPDAALIRQSIADECRTMLRPPVSMIGVPAMEKLAREIARWPAELGEEVAARCLLQVREYLNSPPDLAGDHLTAGRHLYVAFLQEAGEMAGLDLAVATGHLRQSMGTIPSLAEAIRQGRLEEAAGHVGRIATAEAAAYTELGKVVSPNG